QNAVYVGSLQSKDAKDRVRVMNTAQRAVFASGRLLFVRDGALKVQPFDAASLKLSGDPTTITSRVAFSGAAVSLSSSENGVLALEEARSGGSRELVWFDRTGKRLDSVGQSGDFSFLRLSPGGTKLAVRRA